MDDIDASVLDREALIKATALGVGLTLATNLGGFALFWLISRLTGLLGTPNETASALAAASFGGSIFIYLLYLAFGALYTYIAQGDSEGIPPLGGAIGGGLVGLISGLASLTVSGSLFLLVAGPRAGAILTELVGSIGRIGILGEGLSALALMGGIALGGLLIGVALSAASGALYAATNGPHGFYEDYTVPEWPGSDER